MMAAMIGVAAGSAALGAAGALFDGASQAAAGEYNARMLKIQASQRRQQAAEEERKFRIGARKQFGDMRANYAASGVTSEGSPMDVLEESVRNMERDALSIRHQGMMDAMMMESEGKMERFRGRAAKTASYFGASSSLASGAVSAYQISQYGSRSPSTATPSKT